MRTSFVAIVAVAIVSSSSSILLAQEKCTLHGRVVDADTGRVVAARIYITSADGTWHFVLSAVKDGSAVEYRKMRGKESVEMHTTVSAHPFVTELAPGKYTITVERGKEYLPETKTIELTNDTKAVDVRLRRWINMAKSGWYCGETHVHRSLAELPTAMLADDLNVALPLTYWVTQGGVPPSRGNKNSEPVKPELIKVDSTHVIYPMNTEYEIFSVGGKRHTLGAVFALNHKSVFDLGTPPVKPIAEKAHREGALLELDKHNWPWSMMLAPVMNVDLYELTNNHIWRTEFLYRRFGEAPPPYMKAEQDERGMTERGWIDFTWQNYYALLNCGFRLRPTAGCASGVHPVPLGYGRVYVHVGKKFSYEDWMKGLDKGRSFVTTGPMLQVKLNEQFPGTMFESDASGLKCRISGFASSAGKLSKIEIVSEGAVIKEIKPDNKPLPNGGFESKCEHEVAVTESTWIVVRCYEPTSAKRFRFAHTAPWHINVPGKPLRPRREEIRYLIGRMEAEIERNTGVLSEVAIDEFRLALAKYKAIAKAAR